MLRYVKLVGTICLFFSLFGCGSGTATPGAGGYHLGGSIQGRPVSPTGVVTTLAGSAASPFQPFGITTDGTNLYVTDTGNNTIRKIQ
jgi:hypothetical protein